MYVAVDNYDLWEFYNSNNMTTVTVATYVIVS